MSEGLENLFSFVPVRVCVPFSIETVTISSLIMRTYITMYVLICMCACARALNAVMHTEVRGLADLILSFQIFRLSHNLLYPLNHLVGFKNLLLRLKTLKYMASSRLKTYSWLSINHCRLNVQAQIPFYVLFPLSNCQSTF